MNYFISKIPPRHMPLVALIKWQGSRPVEDESLHWDVTESTHVHLATELISRYWTQMKKTKHDGHDHDDDNDHRGYFLEVLRGR